MRRNFLIVMSVFVLAGCASIGAPSVPETEAVGVEAQVRLEGAPSDAAAIGQAMDAAEKPWKKKESTEKKGNAQDGTETSTKKQKDTLAQEKSQQKSQKDINNDKENSMKKTFDRARATALSTQYTGAIMHTNLGDITLELYGSDAPLSVGNFVMLAEDGFYDGVIFHRIISDFMIQGGDPTGSGSGGPGYDFEDEINDHKIVRGALAMANAGPGTNGSQFFVVTAESAAWLDGKHTVFGTVTEGMETVDAIEAVATGAQDKPVEDVVIESIELIGA